jgi:hypothetical protein
MVTVTSVAYFVALIIHEPCKSIAKVALLFKVSIRGRLQKLFSVGAFLIYCHYYHHTSCFGDWFSQAGGPDITQAHTKHTKHCGTLEFGNT